MPLFKKHHKEQPAPTEVTSGYNQPAASTTARPPDSNIHSGNRPMMEDYPGHGHAQDVPPNAMGSIYDTKSGRSTGTHGYETYGVNENPGIHTSGAGMQQVPPSGTLNNQNQSRGGTRQKAMGKMESAMGTVIGSEALKVRGLQKEQEANAIKLQGQELAEAERLEREAMARRERAVAHGAHPANKNPGGRMHDDV